MDRYDAGLLNDFGGGNVSWWHDYIRSELEKAHEFYAEAHAAGLAEGEEKLQACQTSYAKETHDRIEAEAKLTRMKSMSVIEMMLENPNINSHVQEWEARCLKAEAKLVIALREMESYRTHYEQRGLLLKEAEAKLAALEAELKLAQEHIGWIPELTYQAQGAELEGVKDQNATLNAELAAEKAERETAEERGIFVDKRATDMAIEKDALAQELKGARAEAGRMREASNTVVSCWDGGNGRGSDCMDRHIEYLRKALSPEPEKPAPEVKP